MEILNAILQSFTPWTLILTMGGTILGIIFGAIPGLNGTVGVAMLLPITYTMNTTDGLLVLSALYMGSTFGGSISAILLNVPGTGEAACTALDGAPLAKKGHACEALYYSIFASTIGGLLGVFTMFFFTRKLADLALKFSDAEMFLLCIAGLAVVAGLVGKNIWKGIFSCSLGLILACVGIDGWTSSIRFTYGIGSLRAGIDLVAVMVGLFAITEMLTLISNKDHDVTPGELPQMTGMLDALKTTLRHWVTLLKTGVVGTIIGILPGTGAAVGSFIAYGMVRSSKKQLDSTPYGKGNIDGILGPECANNAACGGSYIPLLALGIPGSATSAILYGAMCVHGLNPGPELFSANAPLVYTFMFGMLLAVILMCIFGATGVKLFARVLTVKVKYIVPVVLIFSLIGAYSIRNKVVDVFIALLFGVVGLLFKRFKIPVAPCVLGLILGGMGEKYLRYCMTEAEAADVNLFSFIVFRPISIAVIIFIAAILYFNVKSRANTVADD
ncbi:MAG: tripartite tricarboxylate transporter permease [Eubacteriales bacterium]|jgi:putative tricarboxylic transport membrane protein